MRKKTILLTGGNGFLGKHFIKKYRKKYRILAPSHKKLDLLNQTEVDKFFITHKVNYIIHAAVYGGTRKTIEYQNDLSINLRMLLTILKHKKKVEKIILFGSGAEYDKRRDLKKVKETEHGNSIPIDEYGLAKFLTSTLTANDKKIVTLRPFGLFGPGEDYEIRFISNNVCKAIFGLPLTMKQNKFFDYIYITDFLKIIDFFLTHKNDYTSYNVTHENRIDFLTIAKKISAISGKDLKINIAKKGLGREYTGDISRLKKEVKDFEFR